MIMRLLHFKSGCYHKKKPQHVVVLQYSIMSEQLIIFV